MYNELNKLVKELKSNKNLYLAKITDEGEYYRIVNEDQVNKDKRSYASYIDSNSIIQLVNSITEFYETVIKKPNIKITLEKRDYRQFLSIHIFIPINSHLDITITDFIDEEKLVMFYNSKNRNSFAIKFSDVLSLISKGHINDIMDKAYLIKNYNEI